MQSQVESERINLRPNLISVDRPDSSQLVDLHIYIIPKVVWRNRQNLAENEAMEQAISAGFVHVPQNISIRDLRQYITKVCGQDQEFPKDFIYLRSVGRCLTKVKSQQEIDLCVKHYRPPMTYAPEIYILEGHHDEETVTRPNSKAYLLRESPIQRPSISPLQTNLSRQESWGKPNMEHHHPIPSPRTLTYRTPSNATERKSSINHHRPIGSPRTNHSNTGSTLSVRDIAKLREEQERLRKRQIELARQRHEIEQEQERRKSDLQERRKSNVEENRDKDLQENREKDLREKREKEMRENHEKHIREQQEHEASERRKQEELAARRIQGAYRTYRKRRKLKQQQQEQAAYELERLQREARELARRKAEKEHAEELDAHDVVKLSNYLEELKAKRATIEAARETIVRQMQQLNAQIAVRRKEDRDLWKQKYLVEKKKTSALEERGRATLKEQTDINAQLEEVKIRLNHTTKLRQQAQDECLLLNQELEQLRLQLNTLQNPPISKQPSASKTKEHHIPITLDITLQY